MPARSDAAASAGGVAGPEALHFTADPEANRLFQGRVSDALTRALVAKRLQFSPELAAHFNQQGQSWSQVFGDAANEVFMAWNYAAYIEAVAHAGKSEYALPMYVNAQLPAPQERAGEYPSGGPHPYYLEVWRAAAPSIDFYSPDIYWPNFEYWAQRYQVPGNAIFVPEARLESASYNALYAYGQARAFGALRLCPASSSKQIHAPVAAASLVPSARWWRAIRRSQPRPARWRGVRVPAG